MKLIPKTIVGAAFACVVLIGGNPPANAHPGNLRPSSVVSGTAAANLVETVQSGRNRAFSGQRRGRNFRGNRGNRSRGFGRNAAVGIGSLIIGGIVLSEVARANHRRENSSDWRRCSQTYRSFESDTGMYTGYDGIRRQCPYIN